MPYEFDGTIPTLSELMTIAAQQVAETQYSMLPCEVVSYDSTTQCANVLPLVKAYTTNEDAERLPELPSCPVVFPSGGGMSISWAIAPGDTGHVLFSTLSMSAWQTTGNADGDPGSRSRASLSQGVFIPGLRHQGNPLGQSAPAGIHIGTSDGSKGISIAPTTGKTAINGGAFSVAQAEALMVLLNNIVTDLATIAAAAVVAATGVPLVLVATAVGAVADIAVADLKSD